VRRSGEVVVIGFEKAKDARADHGSHPRPISHQRDVIGGARPRPTVPIKARKHIAALRRSRPGVIIQVRGYPARKGVESDEKAGVTGVVL